MVRKLIGWGLDNPLIVLLLAGALAAYGTYAFLRVNVEAYPDPAPAIIEVVAQFPGASAEETATLLRWVEQPGTRLVSCTAPWSSPARGAGRWRPFMAAVGLARSQLAGVAWR